MIVLDASAVVALLRRETGADRVAAVIDGASCSAVNLAEIVEQYIKAGVSEADTRQLIVALPIVIEAFGEALAYETAILKPICRKAGLSLGDRACLALARLRNAEALTADKAWLKIAGDVGVKVTLIR